MFGLFESGYGNITAGNIVMILIGSLLIYLAIKKNMEPLLLGPIGFATILINLPITGLADHGGFMELVYRYLIKTGIIPLLIFLGIGAMTDFTPLLANPRTFLLGAAAQVGIYCAMFFAIIAGFGQNEAAVIGIIGGADGPTTIYTASRLAPQIMGAVTVAAYSYMALVPMIQPPIIKALTTPEQRKIKMSPLRNVSDTEKLVFPVLVTIITGLLVPSAVPLVGMLMFGNLIKVSGVMDRLSKTSANELINISTIFLGIGVGFMMQADAFLTFDTLKILVLGVLAFATATAGGVLFGQLMYILSKGKINPMIGAAGVSAVPMAARVVNKLGMEEDRENFLMMYAMGPNVAGVIGSAIAAGVFIGLLG